MYDAILHILGGCCDGVAGKRGGTVAGSSAAIGFLSGTPNSQAHDFSMRALRQVQIARRAENSKAIAAMHRRCA